MSPMAGDCALHRVRAKPIKEVTLYAARPVHLRMDLLPFAVAYTALLAAALSFWVGKKE